MELLDELTLDRLARVICDQDGAYERKVWQLEELLVRAGWTDSPMYDATGRVSWLKECLFERRDRRADIERLICRVCDPLEYDEGDEVASVFRVTINSILAAERLSVTLIGGRPVIGDLTEDGQSSYTAPPDLDRRLKEMVKDQKMAAVLSERVRETEACAASGAYTFAIIGIGSFVEGLLYTVLLENDHDIKVNGFRDNSGKPLREIHLGLDRLIKMALATSWIQLDAADFMNKVREYRNYVHPRKQMEQAQSFDRDSVMLCWAPVQAILNDLEEHLSFLAAGESSSV